MLSLADAYVVFNKCLHTFDCEKFVPTSLMNIETKANKFLLIPNNIYYL